MFLDLVMVGMNGAETFREIGRVGPEAFVVVATAYSDPVLMAGTSGRLICPNAKAVCGGRA